MIEREDQAWMDGQKPDSMHNWNGPVQSKATRAEPAGGRAPYNGTSERRVTKKHREAAGERVGRSKRS